MDKKEFDFIISMGEGHNIEFKESFSSHIDKEICAFANANGGKILIGISDKGLIRGIEITNSLKSKIHNIVSNLDPRPDIMLDTYGNILIIDIMRGKNKPYSVNGRFYVRVGPNSQQLTRDEIKEFFQKEGKISFDEKPNEKFDINRNLSEPAFNRFLEKSNITKLLSTYETLCNLELMDGNNIKNAGVLLFSKKITRFFLNAQITCVLFLGKDKTTILDKKEFENDLYTNYKNIIEYMKSKLNTEMIIKNAGPRTERLELPEEALREAVLNAMVHRDYFSNAEIQIYIYNDRIEIVNPGGLVPGMKIEDLGRKSITRNKLLFGMLERMNLVEKAGTGITRIRNTMKEYRLREPVIETDENWFTMTIVRPDLQKESYEQRFYGSPKGSPKSSPKSSPKILELIREDNKITIAQIAAQLSISIRAVKKNIARLKQNGLLRRVGPTNGGYWEIIEEKKQ